MSTDSNCFFCGSECEIYPAPISHNIKDYRCKHCGAYILDDKLKNYVPNITDSSTKFTIACILNERRLKGLGGIALSNKTDMEDKIYTYPQVSVDDILDEFPKKHSDFLNRTLLNLSLLTKSTQPYGIIRLDLANKRDCLHLFTPDKQGCYAFLRELAGQEYIRFNEVAGGPQWDVFFLTTKCWEKVENLQQTDEIHESSDDVNTSMEWDVFICHASEDKEEFVRPLAISLISRDLKVWYDEFTLTVGDSLRRSINKGLANSRYGIVVISPNFLRKDWPQKELDGLDALEVNGRKVILPVWHQIDVIGVRKYSPILADRVATSSEKGIEQVTIDIFKAIEHSLTKGKGVSLTHKFPDEHHLHNFVSASEKKFKKVQNMMPELITQFKTDLSTEDSKFIREFFVLPNNRVCLGGSEKPRLIYYEDEHKGLRNKIDILENQGFLIDVTPGNAPIYRMTEEFVELIIKYG